MGVYIKGMEMPAEGWHKVIRIFSDGTVVNYYDSGVELGKAVPVPKHGRLIDADALQEQMAERRNYVGRLSDPLCLIEDAPTIISAEEDK